MDRSGQRLGGRARVFLRNALRSRSKRRLWAVLTERLVYYAAWSEPGASSEARFQGKSSSMRLMG
jgi:hypothetical protein